MGGVVATAEKKLHILHSIILQFQHNIGLQQSLLREVYSYAGQKSMAIPLKVPVPSFTYTWYNTFRCKMSEQSSDSVSVWMGIGLFKRKLSATAILGMWFCMHQIRNPVTVPCYTDSSPTQLDTPIQSTNKGYRKFPWGHNFPDFFAFMILSPTDAVTGFCTLSPS